MCVFYHIGKERKRISQLELFDEHGALHCYHRSYGVLVASTLDGDSKIIKDNNKTTSVLPKLVAPCSNTLTDDEHWFNRTSYEGSDRQEQSSVRMADDHTTSNSYPLNNTHIYIEALDENTDDVIITSAVELIMTTNEILCQDFTAVRRFWKNVSDIFCVMFLNIKHFATCVCVFVVVVAYMLFLI